MFGNTIISFLTDPVSHKQTISMNIFKHSIIILLIDILVLFTNCETRIVQKIETDISVHVSSNGRMKKYDTYGTWSIQVKWVTHLPSAICLHQVSGSGAKFFINSLAPGSYGSNFKSIISVHMSRIKFMSTSCEIPLWWMALNIFNDEPTLAQVMAWCHRATSHYLSQY